MKNKIEDLRDHLFATIEALQDEQKPMEIARAKAIANAAQVIVNSVKVEVDFIRATGAKGSGFVPDAGPALPDKTAESNAASEKRGPRTIVHRIKG